jgi:hypothetical protein
MKANRPPVSAPSSKFARLGLATALAAMAAACAAPPPPAADWRDRPITPGTWTWSLYGGASSARYGESGRATLIEFRCDRASRSVLMIRPGTGADPTAASVTTTHGSQPLTARPAGGPTPMLVVTIPVRDPLLDAIAFSRGRFAVETQGMAPLYLPAWPEVARVVEDCR